jgi:hypothetical protein
MMGVRTDGTHPREPTRRTHAERLDHVAPLSARLLPIPSVTAALSGLASPAPPHFIFSLCCVAPPSLGAPATFMPPRERATAEAFRRAAPPSFPASLPRSGDLQPSERSSTVVASGKVGGSFVDLNHPLPPPPPPLDLSSPPPSPPPPPPPPSGSKGCGGG